MNTTLDFPPLDDATAIKPYPAEAPPTTAVAAPSLTSTALAPLLAIEQDLRALSERYRDVAYDLKTPKGLAGMKAARHDLRENGRYLVQRAVQKCKDDANAAKKAVEQEAVRLVGLVLPRETEFDEAIVVREREIAAEKAERDRLEAERVAKHRAGIETIRGYVAQAQGRSAADLAGALHTLTGLSRGLDGKAWDEFAQEAADAWAATIGAVERMCSEAVAREHEAARIEAQRVEQARVAAEQAEQQRKLDEQAAAIQRQADELAAERAAAALAQSAAAAAATVARMAAAPIVLATTPNPLIERHVIIADEGESAAQNTQTGANRDASAEQSHSAIGSESPTGRGTDGALALGAAPNASPVGGPMGAEQPAAAGLAGDAYLPASGIALMAQALPGPTIGEDLYWRLHSLSKALESSGRIDEHDYPDAYATILDAMNVVRAAGEKQQ